MPQRQRVAVILAAWCQLRRAEILGLRRSDIDLDRANIAVTITRGPTASGRYITKAPKNGETRNVAIPAQILPDLATHLDTYVADEPDAWVLTGDKGGPCWPTSWPQNGAKPAPSRA